MAMPKGWEEVSIGQICDLVNGRAFKPTDWTATGLPIVRIQNLNKSGAKFNYYDGEVDSKFLVKDGDLLFAWSGTPGTSFGAHVWRGPKAVLNQHIFNIKFRRDAIDTVFLKYAINQTLDEQIEKAHGGVGLRHVTKGKFEETRFPLPPLFEQRRIAAKIDNLSASSKRARDHLDQVRRLIERYRSAVLGAAFRGDLTSTWRVERAVSRPTMRSVGEVITEIRYGTAQKCESSEGGTAVLRIPNISSGSLNLSDLKYARLEPREYEKLRLEEGDVLVIRSNGSADLVGRAALVSTQASGMAYAGYLIRLRADRTIMDPKFMSLLLGAPQVREIIEVGARSTSGVHNINSTELASLMLPIPAMAEQHETVRRIEAAFAWIDRLGAEASSARKLIEQLDQAVLSKAFRGELIPQNPDDEPASVLLERIKAEQSGAAPVRHGRGRPRLATAT